MNIEDFPEEFTEKDLPTMWELIFTRQRELARKYVNIEHKNGLRWTTDIPVDLNDPKGQAQLKDKAWRIVEEVGESFESFILLRDDPIHPKEELADGLHFITELLILSGLDHNDVEPLIEMTQLEHIADGRAPKEAVSDFIMFLGSAMNCLKMKPWKQTHVETDKSTYKEKLKNAFRYYIILMLVMMEPVDILNLYFRKSNVNKFRIRSNY